MLYATNATTAGRGPCGSCSSSHLSQSDADAEQQHTAEATDLQVCRVQPQRFLLPHCTHIPLVATASAAAARAEPLSTKASIKACQAGLSLLVCVLNPCTVK